MYTLLVTGDVPGASTYFNPLLQQTIVPCTSGTRPSSPPNGMHIYETDTKAIAKYNVSAWEYVTGSRNTYTPSLTASTTNPTLGTASVALGWWNYEPGPAVSMNFFIRFGTSGVAAGTGTYSVSLPPGITSSSVYATGHVAVGAMQIADSSSGGFQPGSIFVPAGSTTLSLIGSAPVGAASPWVWAASDYLSGSVIFPI